MVHNDTEIRKRIIIEIPTVVLSSYRQEDIARHTDTSVEVLVDMSRYYDVRYTDQY